VSVGNAGVEALFKYFGKHWGLGPFMEAGDLGKLVYENVKIDNEIDKEIMVLRKKMGCK
jgi:hypothetical protein